MLKKEKGGLLKRRLVSLNEANEVARRLAAAKGESHRVRLKTGNENVRTVDEVAKWMD